MNPNLGKQMILLSKGFNKSYFDALEFIENNELVKNDRIYLSISESMEFNFWLIDNENDMRLDLGLWGDGNYYYYFKDKDFEESKEMPLTQKLPERIKEFLERK